MSREEIFGVDESIQQLGGLVRTVAPNTPVRNEFRENSKVEMKGKGCRQVQGNIQADAQHHVGYLDREAGTALLINPTTLCS